MDKSGSISLSLSRKRKGKRCRHSTTVSPEGEGSRFRLKRGWREGGKNISSEAKFAAGSSSALVYRGTPGTFDSATHTRTLSFAPPPNLHRIYIRLRRDAGLKVASERERERETLSRIERDPFEGQGRSLRHSSRLASTFDRSRLYTSTPRREREEGERNVGDQEGGGYVSSWTDFPSRGESKERRPPGRAFLGISSE